MRIFTTFDPGSDRPCLQLRNSDSGHQQISQLHSRLHGQPADLAPIVDHGDLVLAGANQSGVKMLETRFGSLIFINSEKPDSGSALQAK